MVNIRLLLRVSFIRLQTLFIVLIHAIWLCALSHSWLPLAKSRLSFVFVLFVDICKTVVKIVAEDNIRIEYKMMSFRVLRAFSALKCRQCGWFLQQ